MSFETELKISMSGFPPLSARYCKQILWSTDTSIKERALNGEMVSLYKAQKKYRTRIEGSDLNMLATDELIKEGEDVTIECIQRLCQFVGAHTKKVTLGRPAVERSILFLKATGEEIEPPYTLQHSSRIEFEQQSSSPFFIIYRPILVMKIISYSLETIEWDFKTHWVLELEEK